MTSSRSMPSLLLMSDHGFGPIEWYVNFNVWLLEQGFIALQDSFYVKQKHWFYRRGDDSRVGLQRDEPARPGQPPGEPVPRQAVEPARPAGRVGFPVAAAHRLVADPGLLLRATSARSSST